MSIKFKSVVFVSTLLMLFMSSASAAGTCQRNGDGAVITDADANTGDPIELLSAAGEGMTDSCGAIPDEYHVTFYKLGICTDDPSGNDLSTCQFMLNSNAVNGVPHTISYPTESALATGDFEIATGTYGYMVAILSNKLGIKHTEVFSEALRGSSSSQGTSCWTNGMQTSLSGVSYTHNVHGVIDLENVNNPALTCGTAANAAPVVSYEVIDDFSNQEDCSAFGADASSINLPNGVGSGKLLQSDGATVATSCNNASRILWTINLTTDLVVTESTDFTLSFKLTDAVSVDAASSASVGYATKMGADPFQAILTTR